MNANPYESPETGGNVLPRKSLWPTLGKLAVVVGVLGVVALLLLPAFPRQPREAARRIQCGNNLKQIMLGLQNYHDTYHSFPPAYTVDAAGKPLHSWRTLILPFVEGKSIYPRIDLSKPWDDPANEEARQANPPFFRCPSANMPKGLTTYLAVVTPGSCLQPAQSRTLDELSDGTSRTIVLMEFPSDQAVHWMSPSDASEAMVLGLGDWKRPPHPNITMAVFADGHTQSLSRELKLDVLRALITIAGNDNKILDDMDF
jgi:type II secretory pathway pseudopilin PulG